ncbi:hypothetical protein R1sor_011038 [Riccia sorocarpa]|uniref:BSD domain-containing protein n=1 Tax=Riccia sorocarpa TaxID=122646 RepID=A0ABD3HZR6_9MARC
MDLFLQKAKVFALDAAKKSQELANQAAKMSQELATETAKRSKELAVDVSKKADQLKAYAGELTPVIASKAIAVTATPNSGKPTEEELLEYGITPELREFVQGLTIKTFRDFPLESTQAPKETDEAVKSDHITRQDLTDWQERHAVLVLLSVPEMSDFRYVLCPRRMKESRFWKIYFTLVNSYVAPYEARAKEKAAALAKEKARSAEEGKSASEQATRALKDSPTTISGSNEKGASVKSKNPDIDLDAYLMGVDSDDDGDDDDGSDADFDKLVNSTADSDDDSSPTDDESKKSKQSSRPSATKDVVAVSEGSSDGELVEIPDSESEEASLRSK